MFNLIKRTHLALSVQKTHRIVGITGGIGKKALALACAIILCSPVILTSSIASALVSACDQAGDNVVTSSPDEQTVGFSFRNNGTTAVNIFQLVFPANHGYTLISASTASDTGSADSFTSSVSGDTITLTGGTKYPNPNSSQFFAYTFKTPTSAQPKIQLQLYMNDNGTSVGRTACTGSVALTTNAPTTTTSPLSPAAPVLTGTTSQSTNSLSWNNVASATGYRLYERTNLIYTGLTNSFTHTGLSYGYDYQYHVIAYNGAGDSPISNVVSLTPVAPAPAPTTGSGTTDFTQRDIKLIGLALCFYVSVKFIGLFRWRDTT